MGLSKRERISLTELAMKRVNVIPYEENAVAFGTNIGQVDLGDSEVTVCECYINSVNEHHTCHIGFSAVLSGAVASEFAVEVDGAERMKRYPNTNATVQFLDFFLLGTGMHHISIKAKAESRVSISPREARLGVYL